MGTELMNICESLLKKYGADSQILKYFEEVAESTVAITHYRHGKCDNSALISELVDVYITLTQMLILYDKDELFGEILEIKIEKIKKLLLEEKRMTFKIEIRIIQDETFDDMVEWFEKNGFLVTGMDITSPSEATVTLVDEREDKTTTPWETARVYTAGVWRFEN